MFTNTTDIDSGSDSDSKSDSDSDSDSVSGSENITLYLLVGLLPASLLFVTIVMCILALLLYRKRQRKAVKAEANSDNHYIASIELL